MLTRVLLALTFGSVVLIFLYAPANRSREEFLELLVKEHRQMVAIWGVEHGDRVLARTQWLLGEALRNRLPSELGKPMKADSQASVRGAAARADAEVMDRLLRSDYPRATEALLALSLFRVAALVEVVPLVLPFILAALGDGLAERARRAKEFLPHSPASYGMFLWGMLCTFCALVVVFCYPGEVAPLVSTYALLGLTMFGAGAVGRFVKQG